ncbi:hypothetical protein Pint_15862 [Pistacia integerrima]|uniref:Uncharacterized protein n=1 Tax=Pistacia integerrima TaxID=434235 RepID=A0ACC0ZB62_9ROSI|nr:hypothetical protein Pint_15862 [Pistacia integerrima]
MLQSGFKPDGYGLTHLLRASTHLGLDSYCQQLHSYIIKSGFVSHKIYSLSDAHRLFVEIPQPSVVSWNSLISGYVQSGQYREALSLFLELDRDTEISANAYSFTAALAACGQLRLSLLGALIYSKIVKYGLENDVVLANCLIDMYGKCGSVEDAIRVFEEMIDRDIISWNSVIAACARNGNLEQAFGFFYRLPKPDTISYNELINGIAQFGDIEEAISILSSMPDPNSSSWNSILTGYVNINRIHDALDIFSKMQVKNIQMDDYTFSIVLSGIAGVSGLTWGMLIHCSIVKQGLDTSVVVVSALIDMYSKCGQVKNAESIFRLLPKKNLVTWNAMITGYAHNGDAAKVIQLFEQLKLLRDLRPDCVTFLNVLAACSHNDIPLHKANQYFESMIRDYGIEPTVEHCCSMVRLMGQRGEVVKAGRMIYELGFGSYGVVWRALLGACGACKDLKVAKFSAAKVIVLEGHNDYAYVMMSNIFACHGRWREVSRLRKFMQDRGLRKEAGCSWIEVENVSPYSSMVR